MPNYQNGRIYKIVCNKTELEHINATTLPLCQRIAQHRSELKRFLNGTNKELRCAPHEVETNTLSVLHF